MLHVSTLFLGHLQAYKNISISFWIEWLINTNSYCAFSSLVHLLIKLNKIDTNIKIKLLLLYLIKMVIIIIYNLQVLDLGGHYISMCVWCDPHWMWWLLMWGNCVLGSFIWILGRVWASIMWRLHLFCQAIPLWLFKCGVRCSNMKLCIYTVPCDGGGVVVLL
jgi:hypothetical protein